MRAVTAAQGENAQRQNCQRSHWSCSGPDQILGKVYETCVIEMSNFGESIIDVASEGFNGKT
jgi:hypothetical protein